MRPSSCHVLQAAGLQYNAQPAHDSDSEGSDFGKSYSDEDWLEDEVRAFHSAPKAGHIAGEAQNYALRSASTESSFTAGC